MSTVERAPLALVQSWRRSELSGVDRGIEIEQLEPFEFDREAPLLRAAAPVLDQMVLDLLDAPVAVLLADKHGVILDVRTPAGFGVGAELARTRYGRRCAEEVVGTNALGTALEINKPVRLRGDDHYLTSLAAYDCLGAPIADPITGRPTGALSLCAPRDALHPALAPFLSYAARDVQSSLMTLSPRSHADLLQVFQTATRRHTAVVVCGTGLVLSSPSATLLLDPQDYVMIDQRGAELRRGQQLREEVDLVSGRRVAIAMQRCGRTGEGLLVTLEQVVVDRPRVPRGVNARQSTAAALSREIDTARRGRLSTLITGERGTGRSRLVRQLAGGADVITIDGGQEALDADAWAGALRQALASAEGAEPPVLVVLERVEELSPDAATRAAGMIAASVAWAAVVTPPLEDLRAEHAALAASCSAHVHVPAVRTRTDELADLLDDVSAGAASPGQAVTLRWTPEAVTVLKAHPWPGNFHEMKAMVEHVSSSALNGSVTVADLPSSVKALPRRQLTPLQRSDREVIAAHLRACGGNKVHVARALGISRSTLYKKLRELDLAGH